MRRYGLALAFGLLAMASTLQSQTMTWDGKHDTTKIDVTVVYFVPSDRKPLFDWRDRVNYYCGRIGQFHAREFQGQSTLTASVHPEPMVSAFSTAELRRGDGDAIFFRTLEEVDRQLNFSSRNRDGFPILLILSDINHRPLDDFYRLALRNGQAVFEGNFNQGEHFPGSSLGGARATYLSDRGVGWGLVSADGWRVPYRGSDCVVYHEGLGHTVGLPHPEPGNRSVMSLGQYHGWLSESWINPDQKQRLGWRASEAKADSQAQLFSGFTAQPQPRQPLPGQSVSLQLDWPSEMKLRSLRVRFQTSLDGPWIESNNSASAKSMIDESNGAESAHQYVSDLGVFDRPTPISYRVDLETDAGNAELWGYLQVRASDNQPPQPSLLPTELAAASDPDSKGIDDPPGKTSDLLDGLKIDQCFSVGKWTQRDGYIESNKQYGARLELPADLPSSYRITVVAQPLDAPNGMLLGLRNADHRFAVLIHYATGRTASSAIENIDGKNVGNQTTYRGNLFQQNQLSQVVATVRPDSVQVSVDGRSIIDWRGKAEQLSLSDYWKTPNDQSIFLGAYDCRYRIHRVTIETLQ